MIPKDNLSINRYTWAAGTINRLSKDKLINLKLFDIGSRDEVLKKYLSQSHIDYKGFDLEPLTENIRNWDIEHPFPYNDEKADIISFLEVVEHLNNPWLSIKNLADTLKPNGYLLLTTPNPQWSNSRVDLLLKGQLSCFSVADLISNHHVFTPWPHIIEKLLNDNGFDIIEFVTLDGKTNLLTRPWSIIRFPMQIGFRLVKKIIETFDKRSCGMSYALLAQKRDE